MRIVGILALVGLIGCGGRGSERSERARSATPSTGQESHAAAVAERPEISPDRALVLRDGALVRLAPSGRTEALARTDRATSCQVDRVHGVVWLIGEEGISVYDPRDGAVHHVVRGAGPTERWLVRYGEGAPPSIAAGNADPLEHCVALALELNEPPRAGGVAIASGDREPYCFEDDSGDAAQRALQPEAAEEMRRYDRAQLLDLAYLAQLPARRAEQDRRSPPPLEAPAPPTPVLNEGRCEEIPEACGELGYVGGGRLWWVVTENSRGDFFHETRQLYDAIDGVFWDLATGRRASAPLEGAEEAPALHVSPDGTWGLYADQIIALAAAEAIGRFDGSLCGFDWEPADAGRARQR